MSQLIWLAVGLVFAGVCVSLSVLIHGFPFDRDIDVFMVFVIGISASLFMGAVFYPLFYLGGDERNEVILIVSLVCSVAAIAGLSSVINNVLGTEPTTAELVGGAMAILGVAAAIFVASCFLTIEIFMKREY